MRPRERRESGEQDLFRSRLDQVINMDHALAKLARTIDWGFLEEKFGAVYADGSGRPPLPTRLMAGLAILKHTYNLSDESACSPSLPTQTELSGCAPRSIISPRTRGRTYFYSLNSRRSEQAIRWI